MRARYALGLDFGTESARALLVDADSGEVAATAVFAYPDGVIDRRLPGGGPDLPADWALQNPDDWTAALESLVPRVLGDAGADASQVVGLGVDFTSCTILPTAANGTPLCVLDAFRALPHAWPKLWKHHAAQRQADRINALARERGEAFVRRYGNRISSEWLLPKALSVLEETPDVFDAAVRIIEAADWIVWRLTGNEFRNACSAGYKACWEKASGYPSAEFLEALHPGFGRLIADKLAGDVHPPGALAGGLTEQWAARLGLAPGTPVAAAIIDAHAGALGLGVSEPGVMAMIMGTSTCHMVMGAEPVLVEGISGVVEDGILPGLFGYEAGQAGVGDIFAWFVERHVPADLRDQADRRWI